MRQFRQKVHRDLPPTTLWGYNGSWPGSTIEAQTGQPIQINWVSKLPKMHLLPIDYSIHGAEATLPAVRMWRIFMVLVFCPMTMVIRRLGSPPAANTDLSSIRAHRPIQTASLRQLCGITITAWGLPG